MPLGAQVLYIFAIIVCAGVKSCWTFIYPGNSAYGIFAAIAVPLNIPHRNVFVSYNFEANYNLPGDAKTIIPGPYQRFTPVEETDLEEMDVNAVEEDVSAVEEVEESGRKKSDLSSHSTNYKSGTEKKSTNSKALITRRTIYQMLRDKLKVSGFKGGACLLKLICEANASLLGRNNGVFGSLVHILLTMSYITSHTSTLGWKSSSRIQAARPSTSANENLPIEMYKAEENGVMADCLQYENKCPHNILDLLSAPIENYLHNYL